MVGPCFSPPCLPLAKPSAPTPCAAFTPCKIFMLHAQIHQLLLNDKLADATAYLREDIKKNYHHFEDAKVAKLTEELRQVLSVVDQIQETGTG